MISLPQAEAEGKVHPLFSGAASATLGKIILSTSTLSSDALENGGFGRAAWSKCRSRQRPRGRSIWRLKPAQPLAAALWAPEEGSRPLGGKCSPAEPPCGAAKDAESSAFDHPGPVNDECYAIGYGIRDIGCRAQVMSYQRDSQGFIDCLHQGMRDMRDVMESEQ